MSDVDKLWAVLCALGIYVALLVAVVFFASWLWHERRQRNDIEDENLMLHEQLGAQQILLCQRDRDIQRLRGHVERLSRS